MLWLLQGIYEQLNLAAEAFLEGEDGCQVDMNKRQIKLSQILKWYSVDFGKNKEEVYSNSDTSTCVLLGPEMGIWETGGLLVILKKNLFSIHFNRCMLYHPIRFLTETINEEPQHTFMWRTRNKFYWNFHENPSSLKLPVGWLFWV